MAAEKAPHSFRNLVVWQKAQQLTLDIVKVVSDLPRDKAAPIFAQQVIRSASSIAANIAEGHGRFTLAAHRNHLSIAKGSACETDGWIDLLRRAGYISDATEVRRHSACDELIRMLTAKIVDFERRERETGKQAREARAVYSVDDAGVDA